MSNFRHTPDNLIEINGEQFDLEIFLEVEPEYSLPEECVSRYYDGATHIIHTKNSQFAGELPWKDGERYINRVPDLHLMLETLENDKQYIEALKKQKPKEPTRADVYPQIQELVVAMWEHFVEGKSKKETINIVQEKRLKVKEKFPNEHNL